MLAGALLVATGNAESLLKNGTFPPEGWATTWRAAGDAARAETDPTHPGGSALRVDIREASGKQGEVAQTVRGLAPDTRYALRGQLRSTTAGAGFLQVKRCLAGKEVERLSSAPSAVAWDVREVVFSTAGADRIDVLCRTNPSERHVGSSVWFAELEILPRPAVPLRIGNVTPTPTLHALGLVVETSGDWTESAAASARYRAEGSATWQEALPLVPRPSESQFRGSLLDLMADTTYEVEVAVGNDGGTHGVKARTWPKRPPIGRTVFVDDQLGLSSPYVMDLKGAPEAWTLVKPRPGGRGIIEGAAGTRHALLVEGAAYVVLEGFTIRGGDDDAVRIQKSHDVMLVGCDIAEWGEVGAPNAAGVATNASGKAINMQSGISVHSGSERIRLERNFIHAPRGSANSWQHGHPHGPTGISLSNPLGNILVLDNDLIGSETHRWNDGIEGEYNSYLTGGPHRDSDIEGNVVAFANDDGVELDGGQINVRCAWNHFRWTYCGVSCAPNRLGPSYVYRNLVVLGDARNHANFGFKMGGAEFANQGLSHLLHNTVVSHGAGLSAGHYGKGPSPIFSRNNLFHLSGLHYTGETMVDLDYDLYPPAGLFCRAPGQEAHGLAAVARFVDEEHGDYRLDPSSPGVGAGAALSQVFVVDKGGTAPNIGAMAQGAAATFPPRDGRVELSALLLPLPKDGLGTVGVTFSAESGTAWTAIPNSPWLRCSPATGSCDGTTRQVRIEAALAEMAPGRHRGAVTFRSDGGWARTVFVTIDVTAAQPLAVFVEAEDGEHTGFVIGTSPVARNGRYLVAATNTPQRAAAVHFDVEVPVAGRYHLWARSLCEGPETPLHDSFFFGVDGSEPRAWSLGARSPVVWTWQAVDAREGSFPTTLQLSAGRHRVTFLSREPGTRLDAICVGNQPPLDKDVLDVAVRRP